MMRSLESLFIGLLFGFGAVLAEGAEKTVADPSLRGYHVDRCLYLAQQCDEPAATAWCRTQGYQRATRWQWRYATPTLTVGDGKVCEGGGCGGFSSITCTDQVAGSPPVASPGVSPRVASSAPSSGGGQYLGCFKDEGETVGRDLNGAVRSDSRMTTAMCVSECRAKGFAYAGTQYSSYCFCGGSYGKYSTANNCDMKCSGNAGETCGGAWANSVYATGSVQTRPPTVAKAETPRPVAPTPAPSAPAPAATAPSVPLPPGAPPVYNCQWGIGEMPGCVGLHYGFRDGDTQFAIDLFNLAADPTSRATPQAQQAVIAQLRTGVLDALLQDDTIVYCAQLVLNGGLGRPLCDANNRTQGAGVFGDRMVINAVDNDPQNRLWNCSSNRVPFGRDGYDLSRCFTFNYRVPPGGIRSATMHIALKVLEGSSDALIMALGRPGGSAPAVAQVPRTTVPAPASAPSPSPPVALATPPQAGQAPTPSSPPTRPATPPATSPTPTTAAAPVGPDLRGEWTGTSDCPGRATVPWTITIKDQTGSTVMAALRDGSPLQGSRQGDEITLQASWGTRWVAQITRSGGRLQLIGKVIGPDGPNGCTFVLGPGQPGTTAAATAPADPARTQMSRPPEAPPVASASPPAASAPTRTAAAAAGATDVPDVRGDWPGTVDCLSAEPVPLTITIKDQTGSTLTGALGDGTLLQGRILGDEISFDAPGQRWHGVLTRLKLIGQMVTRDSPTPCSFTLNRPRQPGATTAQNASSPAALPIAPAEPPADSRPPPPRVATPTPPAASKPPAQPAAAKSPPPSIAVAPPPTTVGPKVEAPRQPPVPVTPPASAPITPPAVGSPTADAPRVAMTPATTAAAATPAGDKPRGPCEGNARLTSLHARCALEMSIKLTPEDSALDMDGKDGVTSYDAVIILQRTVGK
jgi:hypothetical protein